MQMEDELALLNVQSPHWLRLTGGDCGTKTTCRHPLVNVHVGRKRCRPDDRDRAFLVHSEDPARGLPLNRPLDEQKT